MKVAQRKRMPALALRAVWSLSAIAIYGSAVASSDSVPSPSYLNCAKDVLFEDGFDSPPAPLALTTFSLSGDEQNVVPPGTSGLEFAPDLHMTFIQQTEGSFNLWVSAGGAFGTDLFHTSDLSSLGAPTMVFAPSGPGTAAFDADYAGPGNIFPAANGTDLLMVYHAENHLFSGVDYAGTPFYAGIGLARSSDGGVTWQRQGQIISAHDPQQATQSSPGAGASTPTVVKANGFIYAIFREIDLQSNVKGFAIARASIASDGIPGSWQKYYQGSFSSPGLGGDFTPLGLVLDPTAPSDQRQPHLSFNTYLNQYLMTMVGNGGIYVLTSSDLVNWSAGTVVLPSQFPDDSITNSEVHDWYPTLISPSTLSDRCTSQTGYVYYAKFLGDGTAHHYMYRQAFSISGK